VSPPGLFSTYPITTMITRINNTICLLVVAAVFAMIGIEAGNQAGATHSGTQPLVEVRK
jgi:hypothetical protein